VLASSTPVRSGKRSNMCMGSVFRIGSRRPAL
jgi:hypothetical protein